MRILWETWIWPLLILLSTLAVTLITFLFPSLWARPAIIMGFLFVIPGMTVVRFFRINGPAVEWMLAIALSFSIDAFVAGIILYTGQWSPTHIISFLIGFCFSGAIAQLAILRPASALARLLPSTSEEDEVTLDLTKLLPSTSEDEVTLDLTKLLPSTSEDAEITLDLAKLLPSTSEEDEVTLDLKNVEDPEDTKERPAVLVHFHQLLREDTQEKTISLDKPELMGKEV